MPTPSTVSVTPPGSFEHWVDTASKEADNESWKKDRATGHWLAATVEKDLTVRFFTQTPRGKRREVTRAQAKLVYNQLIENNRQMKLFRSVV